MLSLEQVSRRVFSDPSWFVKTVVGMLAMFFPLPLVFGAGYVYRVALQGRMGQPIVLPDWDDWRGLFVDGVRFLALIFLLAFIPILAGWLVSVPVRLILHWLPGYWLFQAFLYLPMVPGLLLAIPLTAAGLYRFQRRESFRDAVRPALLLRMVVASKGRLVIPTLAYVGVMVVLFPVLPYAMFTGGVVVFYYASSTFLQIEQAARERASAPVTIRR